MHKGQCKMMVADADATITVYQRGGDANKPAAMIIHPPRWLHPPGGFCIPATPVTRDNRVTAGPYTGRRLGARRRGSVGQDRPTRCKKRPGWGPDGRETVTAAPIYHIAAEDDCARRGRVLRSRWPWAVCGRIAPAATERPTRRRRHSPDTPEKGVSIAPSALTTA